MGMYPGGNIIRVTPTLSTDAYADADVLFAPIELPNIVPSRGGVSLITNVFVIDKERQTCDFDIHLHESSISLGTVNATANVSHDNYTSANLIGCWRIDADQGEVEDLDNLRVHAAMNIGGGNNRWSPMLIKAAGGATSIYASAHINGGTPTYAADSLQLIFNVQYLG